MYRRYFTLSRSLHDGPGGTYRPALLAKLAPVGKHCRTVYQGYVVHRTPGAAQTTANTPVRVNFKEGHHLYHFPQVRLSAELRHHI